ncbi:hypothetical protein MMMDOFMJ_4276 [Methylobacterium gnaphalii]|nr:hypothetical protein MMMDOFMJ_4276 [Methylobacterium gnaphalii]
MRADLIPFGLGEGPDERDPLHLRGVDREQVAPVLEQHEAGTRRLAGDRAGLAREQLAFGGRRVEQRTVEQAEAEFQAQHAAHGGVEGGLRDPPGPHLLRQVLHEQPAGHVHVHAGREGLAGRLGTVLGHAVLNQARNRLPVGDGHALEAELAPQDLRHEVAVGRRRQAVERGQRGHHRVRARADAVAERRQVGIVELGGRHPGHIVVAPAIDGAVAGEVLQGGGDAAVAKTFDLGGGELAGQPGILAETLDHATPAQVAGDIGHRREGPVDADGETFPRRRRGRTPHEAGIEARRHADRQRQHGAVAVDDVEADQQGNAEPRGAGIGVDGGGEVLVREVDDGPHLAAPDALGVEAGFERDEVELAGLLLQRHLAEQRLEALVERLGSGQRHGAHERSRRDDACADPNSRCLHRLLPDRPRRLLAAFSIDARDQLADQDGLIAPKTVPGQAVTARRPRRSIQAPPRIANQTGETASASRVSASRVRSTMMKAKKARQA